MLAVEQYPSSDFFENYPFNDFPKHELLEVNRSKVSIHNAKAGYSYPTIRLPYSFSMLAGLSTQIYQTVHKGALAFLVVISKGAATEKSADLSENAQINPKPPSSHGGDQAFESPRAHLFFEYWRRNGLLFQ